MLYYYHWISGHKQGFSPLPYTAAEIERMFQARRKDDPGVTYELIEAEEE
jgi:hypothetical protein